ncbi:hypothetical protein VNO77_40741 [Canavalia gladiata]|uniref:Uncharacterized protein n=1 Tax=Canavalia gladiata TaxID=3824 RepID=A0AAN9K020_CANGL
MLVGTGTDTDKQREESVWGPSSKGSVGSTRATQKPIIKKGTAWVGLQETEMVRGGPPLTCRVHGCGCNTRMRSLFSAKFSHRGIPRLGAPIHSFHGTVHMRCPHDF